MPPLVGGGIRKGICGVLLLDGVRPEAPPLPGLGGDVCMLNGPAPLFKLGLLLLLLHIIEPSDELGEVIAVGGDGGAEVELVGEEVLERIELCGPENFVFQFLCLFRLFRFFWRAKKYIN